MFKCFDKRKIEDVVVPKERRLFIVYENNEIIWEKVYSTFELAMKAVTKKIDAINEQYKKTPEFKIEPELPGQIEYNTNETFDPRRGVLVANLYDYEIHIYIKEVKE